MEVRKPWSFRGALTEGWEAARLNARAILLIQATAVATVILYYQWPAFAAATRGIDPWRQRWGLPLTFVLGFIAGGLIPEIAKLLTRQVTKLDRAWLSDTAFIGFVYGCIGIQVDVFYRLQAIWFGHSVDWVTIAKKLFVDMAIAAPIIFIPFTVGMFLWREHRFRLAAFRELFTLKTYRERILNIQIVNWFVWVPVLIAVYALPLPLQFPLSALVEACWSLLMVVMATKPPPASAPTPQPL